MGITALEAHNIFYEPLPFQQLFHDSRAEKVYLSAGYGAGKTYALCMKMFQLMSENAGLPGGMLAPSLKMFKRDVLPTIREICEDNAIDYKYHQTDHYFYFPLTDSTIYVFHGEDDGVSIRGPNLAFMLINEVTLISKPTFDAAIARVRLKEAPLLQTAMVGTPEGFNWNYEYFVENPRTDTALIFGDMRLNTHIAESYSRSLLESYDELMASQFVEGKFVNLTSKAACYAFNRHVHTDPEVEKMEMAAIWITVDFNVSPMSALLMNPLPPAANNLWLNVYDEVCLESSNTYELCDVLKSKVDLNAEYVTIYPDPAGNASSTKSRGMSDIAIMKEAGFTDIKFKPRIASIRDCMNATNNLFSKKRVIINSKRCRNFIADCEQVVYRTGTFEFVKTNPKRTHWLDGFKNMADYEFPVKKGGGARSERIR